MRFLIPKLAMMAFFSIRVGNTKAFFRGLKEGITGLKQIRGKRTPIKTSTVRYLASLDEMRPNWRIRLARHRTSPQI
jgi:hypothetical protein